LDLAASRGRYEALYQSQYAMFGSSVIGKLVRQPVTELDSWGLAPERLRDLRERTRDLDPVEAVSLLESELFLSDRLLRDADSVSMDHSLEVRVPFVDTEVSDALDQLSPSFRFKPVGRKEPLRSAAAVDPAFFSRPKRGFEFPMDRWLRNELRPLIQDQLLDPEASLALGLNPTELSRIWTLYLDRPGSYYWTRIWALFVLLRWSRINNVTIQ
jgi:asparagine synthase (glutamine-hydrolysing)